MVSIAYRMMHLDGQRQIKAAIPLKLPPDGKDGQQIFSVACDVQMKAGKAGPGQYRYVEGIGWPSGLGDIMDVRPIRFKIRLIGLQEGGIILRKRRPKAGEGLRLLVKDRVSGRHAVVYAQPLLGSRRPEFRDRLHRVRQQPEHGGV